MDIASTNENRYIGAAAILEKKKKYIILDIILIG